MDFKAEITLENPGRERIDVTIRRGTLLENQRPELRVQNLMVAKDYPVSIAAHDKITFEVDCYCANQSFRTPRNAPMSITPFVAKVALSSQDKTWEYFSAQR